ncbi:MAG: hypothetical protein HQL63_13695 [Magnetococcales bacterium]|nr:hypothetical protein [Magnetococcales bacterium]MBF0322786.1 hypothetical protein [Magnetococcales bacterium]
MSNKSKFGSKTNACNRDICPNGLDGADRSRDFSSGSMKQKNEPGKNRGAGVTTGIRNK